jgi:hypothetical protein
MEVEFTVFNNGYNFNGKKEEKHFQILALKISEQAVYF